MMIKTILLSIFSLFISLGLWAEEKELTPEEKRLAETYFHQGLSQRTMQEECSNLSDPKACQGRGSKKFLGVSSSTVKTVSQASATVIGIMSQSGMGKFKKVRDERGNKLAEDEQSNKEDYCSYVAIGTEAIAMAAQTFGQQSAQAEMLANKHESQQRQALYQAARSHDMRASTAKKQAIGWGATAACYSYYLYQEQIKGDIHGGMQLYIKLGASAFLAAFYMNEAKSQKNFSKEVNKIADKLPSKGDCNPITDTACYCAQPETKYDSNHCLGSAGNTGYQMPCLDKDLKSDPECKCKKTNSCFDQSVLSGIDDKTLQQFLGSGAGIDAKSLFNGTPTSSDDLSETEEKVDQLTEMANNLVKDTPIPEDPNLPEGDVQTLSTYGLNDKAAGIVASGISEADPQDMSRIAKSSATPIQSAPSISKGALSGKGADLSTKKDNGEEVSFNFLKNYGKNGNQRSPSSKILDFAQRAREEAEVSKDTSRPIWESISHRYQNSGWDRLRVDE